MTHVYACLAQRVRLWEGAVIIQTLIETPNHRAETTGRTFDNEQRAVVLQAGDGANLREVIERLAVQLQK